MLYSCTIVSKYSLFNKIHYNEKFSEGEKIYNILFSYSNKLSTSWAHVSKIHLI